LYHRGGVSAHFFSLACWWRTNDYHHPCVCAYGDKNNASVDLLVEGYNFIERVNHCVSTKCVFTRLQTRLQSVSSIAFARSWRNGWASTSRRATRPSDWMDLRQRLSTDDVYGVVATFPLKRQDITDTKHL
jgi:hypothetical protein